MARALRLASLLALFTLSLTACSDPPNTQYLPIGSRCDSNDDCGTSPFGCATAGFPGGYCERTCRTDGDCPTDAICVAAAHCRRKCVNDASCRQAEGYSCHAAVGASFTYCELPGG